MKQIALVTGASRGIGRGIALQLAREGWDVCVNYIQHRESAGEVVSQIRALGQNAIAVQADVADSQAVFSMVKTAEAELGPISLLVNNAGVAPRVRLDILETTEESYDFVMDTNLKGAFFMTQAAANAMIAHKKEDPAYSPRIVTISSMSAYTSSTNRGEYCISKAGLSMVTALFADRLAEYGIPVFEVRPGIIQTDMTAAVTEKYQKLIDGGLTPIRRMGQPSDVAECVSALASGKLDFATGQVLNADGGFHLRRL